MVSIGSEAQENKGLLNPASLTQDDLGGDWSGDPGFTSSEWAGHGHCTAGTIAPRYANGSEQERGFALQKARQSLRGSASLLPSLRAIVHICLGNEGLGTPMKSQAGGHWLSSCFNPTFFFLTILTACYYVRL